MRGHCRLIKLINALLAVVFGVLGALVLYWVLNKIVEKLPNKARGPGQAVGLHRPCRAPRRALPHLPAIRTIILSFANSTSTAWVGTENYTNLLGSSSFQQVLINTLLWMIVVPTMSVALGLVVAVLADRLNPRNEKLSKSLIFMPMAISMVGASAIWKIIYEAKPAGSAQTGLLNAIWVGLGGEPQAWLQFSQLRINSLLLMVILIWLQAGFCMVLLSAGIKGCPRTPSRPDASTVPASWPSSSASSSRRSGPR